MKQKQEKSKCCGAEIVDEVGAFPNTIFRACSACGMSVEPSECEHICSGNCRRVGCNCECGEYHEIPETPKKCTCNPPMNEETIASIGHFLECPIVEGWKVPQEEKIARIKCP